MLLHVPIKGCLLPARKSTDLASRKSERGMADQRNEEGSSWGQGKHLEVTYIGNSQKHTSWEKLGKAN